MNINALAQKLLDLGNKRMCSWECKTSEGDICRLKTAGEWRNVEGSRSCNLLRRYQALPEVVDHLCLGNPVVGQMGIKPSDSRVSIQLSIIAL